MTSLNKVFNCTICKKACAREKIALHMLDHATDSLSRFSGLAKGEMDEEFTRAALYCLREMKGRY